MAIAIRFEATCDVCASEDVNTPDAETYEFPALMGAPAFVVELCERHYEIMRGHWAGYASIGRAPEKGATRRRKDAAPDGPYVCPKCQHTVNTIGALRLHVRDAHETSLAGVGFYPANFTCEECGEPFPNRQGMAAHSRTAHGIKQPA